MSRAVVAAALGRGRHLAPSSAPAPYIAVSFVRPTHPWSGVTSPRVIVAKKLVSVLTVGGRTMATT